MARTPTLPSVQGDPHDAGDHHTSPEGRSPMSVATPTAPTRVQGGLLDPKMLLTSLPDAARKVDPRVMVRNPGAGSKARGRPSIRIATDSVARNCWAWPARRDSNPRPAA